MVKLPQRPGAADRGAWPIAAPPERVAKLLRVNLADVTAVAERVARSITADGRRLSSVELIERAIDPGYEALASPRLEIIPEDARRPWSPDSTGWAWPYPHQAEYPTTGPCDTVGAQQTINCLVLHPYDARLLPRSDGSSPRALIISLMIQTIQRDPSGSDQIDGIPNVRSPDPSRADLSDVEHPPTDLAVGPGSGGCDVEFDDQGTVVADRGGDHPGATGPDDPGRIVAQDMVQLLGGGGIGPGPAPPGLRPAPPRGQ
jgi:hypothetical protein